VQCSSSVTAAHSTAQLGTWPAVTSLIMLTDAGADRKRPGARCRRGRPQWVATVQLSRGQRPQATHAASARAEGGSSPLNMTPLKAKSVAGSRRMTPASPWTGWGEEDAASQRLTLDATNFIAAEPGAQASHAKGMLRDPQTSGPCKLPRVRRRAAAPAHRAGCERASQGCEGYHDRHGGVLDGRQLLEHCACRFESRDSDTLSTG
jgi:hypothetical protein